MKPVSFDYFRPASLEEAIALLHYYGGDAKLLAGGQSLIPLLNMRLARPSARIDLSGIPDLDDIKQDGQVLAIGAMVRHHSVECSTLVAERCPLLREAMSYVGHVAIRTRGTFGGSIAHADPSAEVPAVTALLDASFRIVGPTGERSVPWHNFFVTALKNISITTGDTANVPYGIGTFASRVGALGNSAVKMGAIQLRARILKTASSILEVAPEDLELAAGKVRVKGAPGRSLSLADMAVQSGGAFPVLPCPPTLTKWAWR